MVSTPIATPSPDRIGILVVDDEAGLRSLLEIGLGRNGFTVWTASDGQEALDVCRRHAAAIRLVLLDVQMPVLDGPRTLSAPRALAPDLIVCFMSGELGAYTEQELRARGAVRIFPKPFSLNELISELRELAGLSERRGELRLAMPQTAVTLGGQPAQVRDRSAGGLGLWTPAPVRVGSVLGLRLEGSSVPERPVEVRHCQPEEEGWAVGCRYVG